jgi:hypothetical protein
MFRPDALTAAMTAGDRVQHGKRRRFRVRVEAAAIFEPAGSIGFVSPDTKSVCAPFKTRFAEWRL